MHANGSCIRPGSWLKVWFKDVWYLQVFSFTAPYSTKAPKSETGPSIPWYNPQQAIDFQINHGMGVRAVGEEPVL